MENYYYDNRYSSIIPLVILLSLLVKVAVFVLFVIFYKKIVVYANTAQSHCPSINEEKQRKLIRTLSIIAAILALLSIIFNWYETQSRTEGLRDLTRPKVEVYY